MKEYRLLAWPDLPNAFQRTAHRRVLSDMSLRFMTLAQLGGGSGLRKNELRDLMNLLAARGLLDQRDCSAAANEPLEPVERLGWWRRSTMF